MAENVILSVQLSGAESAIMQLTQLDSIVKSLKTSRNINISVNARSLNTAAASAEKLSSGLTQATSAAKQVGSTGAKGITAAGEAAAKASRNVESFRIGMGSVIANMAKFRLASTAINLAANAFADAFKEMKAVDSELVNIRKVTGFTNKEIDKLSKTAFSLATNYGRSASEVLQASTVFARAGYTDQIEQLSELSLLLQNVGDLEAENASKFIIATDKAYKLGGSYENLMAIIDGLDNITNKNATDMQKMTEGMTVAGSVFAESGESVELFAALLGTATANTQRSGTEVARGLRTILMNLRQIRGETEDGELIDGESIAAAATALRDYAGISTMENGQLRKASDVLTELAGKWDTLTETQRAAVAEAVAGKRQANILMSLMGDWESVQKMMQDYEEAAGTAAAENAMYMESWAAKTEQVKAAWTELIAELVQTDSIKGLLDSGISLVHMLKTIGESDVFQALFGKLNFEIQNAAQGIEYLTGVLDSFFKGTAQEDRNYTASVYNKTFSGSIESANVVFTESKDVEAYARALQEVVAGYADYYSELVAVKNAGEELTEQEQRFVDAYELVAQTYAEGGDAALLYGKMSAAAAYASGDSWETSAEVANGAISQILQTLDEIPEVKTINVNVVGNATGALTGIAATVAGLAGGNVSGFASGTNSAPGGPALVNENGPEMISANGIAWIAGGGRPTVTMLPRGATVLTAQQTRRAMGGRRYSGIPAFKDGTYSNMNDTAGAAHQLASVFASVKNAVENYAITAADLKTPSKSGSVFWSPTGDPVFWSPTGSEPATSPRSRKNAGGGGGPGGSGGGSGGRGYSAPDFKALENELAKLLKNLDAQAELAENEEDFLRAMQVYGEAQNAIADLLDQYRANGYAEDSDEVLRLANLGYDYAAKQLGGYDKLQKNLIDALNALTKSTDDANELAERREAVDKAREALANAERQRTVRIYNPVTGQWEWVANASDVTRAQENLKNAEEALRKEELSQAIDAIKNASAGDLGNMVLSPAILDALFGGTPEQQSAFLNALGAATGGADWLASSAAQTPWNQGNSIGTQYNFNGITLTEAQASGMTIKELISMLQGLKIM